MAKVLAWCAQTMAFDFHPAMHMPVGLAAIHQMRERVTRIYAFIDAGGRKSGERTNLISYPISLRPLDASIFHSQDHYDEMPAHTERGHLIADVYGGDDDERNLVPMPRLFNQQTWKMQVEAALTTLAAARTDELLGMKIDCHYDGRDPRIPSRYSVDFYTFGKKNDLRMRAGWENVLSSANAIFGDIPRGYQSSIGLLFNPFNFKHMRTLTLTPSLPGPIVPEDVSVVGTMSLATLQELVTELREPLLRAHAVVTATGWRLENTRDATFFSFKLPPPHRRPYAALDYMLESDALQRIHPKLERMTLSQCFRANGFDDWQRELIFAANMIFHGYDALLVSDNEDDEVYREVEVTVDLSAAPAPRSTMGRYEYAVREWAQAVNLPPRYRVPRGALFLDSTAFAPQVDHIIAKAGSGNGIDAFSNAQVVSGRWNRAKSDDVIEPGTVSHVRQWRSARRGF
ncbi:MAG TPA: DNA/RNA non-specific endonuclease [Trinickia sp.]|uniref:DNA/RNA non-specific endonuclease n=1 Tax=Trinickia sp. TaxID=2571163 RepID=UPI002BC25875|nr:DNA/RNA non-specific endonuclease [Trinickia sp.]HVW51827.1 DNA/RNA non-specific endonuclease [Trinickia sp.]